LFSIKTASVLLNHDVCTTVTLCSQSALTIGNRLAMELQWNKCGLSTCSPAPIGIANVMWHVQQMYLL